MGGSTRSRLRKCGGACVVIEAVIFRALSPEKKASEVGGAVKLRVLEVEFSKAPQATQLW